MKKDKKGKSLVSRRATLKGVGAIGALGFLGSKTSAGKEETPTTADLGSHSSETRKKIFQKVFETVFTDSAEVTTAMGTEAMTGL